MDRRALLRGGAGLLLGSAAAMGLGSGRLLRAASLAAPAVSNDYRALVCVYLVGGNDSLNAIVPASGAAYQEYAASRGDLAVPQGQLLPVGSVGQPALDMGFHPKLPGLRQRFLSGDLAVVSNVGTLNAPTTKADVAANASHLPVHLFSHADQQRLWCAPSADTVEPIGWGGLVAEELATLNSVGSLPVGISFRGPNPWQGGTSASPYSMGSEGAAEHTGFDDNFLGDERWQAFQDLIQQNHSRRMAKVFAEQHARAIEYAGQVGGALAAAPSLSTPFPGNNELAAELRTIALLASQHQQLGVARQVFYLAMDGYDTHNGHLSDQPKLFEALDDALSAFQSALEELGLANKVTTFTASEFGRTLSSNGQGSDHGWGGHQFVMGGAVNGGASFGPWPSLALGGPDDAGYGRLVPTTSVDQMAATLARWLGVGESALAQLFPNVGNFATSNLGFLAA